jgi:hypothetical protein
MNLNNSQYAPIYYGSFVGIFEHFVGLAPRTLIDYKQYYDSHLKLPHFKGPLVSNIKSLYKGSLPYLSGISLSHIWLFSFLEMSKSKDSLNQLLYGAIGKSGHDIFMLPGDTVRMYSNVTQVTAKEALKEIYKQNGIRGFFRGLTPSLLMNIPTGAIEFSTILYLEKMFGNEGLKPFLYGAITGIVSSVIISPLDTIKTFRQMQKGKNMVDIYNYILSNRGWKGFFRGVGLRSFQCCLSYGTYQWLTKTF